MMSWNAVSSVEILVLSYKQGVEFCYEGDYLIDDITVLWHRCHKTRFMHYFHGP